VAAPLYRPAGFPRVAATRPAISGLAGPDPARYSRGSPNDPNNPGSWKATIRAIPGTLITHTHEQSGDLLSPWQGFGVLCIWTVLALAAAAYLLERRDA